MSGGATASSDFVHLVLIAHCLLLIAATRVQIKIKEGEYDIGFKKGHSHGKTETTIEKERELEEALARAESAMMEVSGTLRRTHPASLCAPSMCPPCGATSFWWSRQS